MEFKQIVLDTFKGMISRTITVKDVEITLGDYMPTVEEFDAMTEEKLAERLQMYLAMGIARYFSANTAGGKAITKEKFLTYKPGTHQVGQKGGLDRFTISVIRDLVKHKKAVFGKFGLQVPAGKFDDEANKEAWATFKAEAAKIEAIQKVAKQRKAEHEAAQAKKAGELASIDMAESDETAESDEAVE